MSDRPFDNWEDVPRSGRLMVGVLGCAIAAFAVAVVVSGTALIVVSVWRAIL